MDKKHQPEKEEAQEIPESDPQGNSVINDRPDSKDAQIEDLKGRLARALADYDNLRRRGEEEKKLYFELATVNVLTKFFPLLSNLEKAFEATQDPGIGMVLKQFTDLLSSEGLKEIESDGDFDPNFHEAITSEVGEEDGKVLKVLEKGYSLNGKVVKPARVIVSRKGDQ